MTARRWSGAYLGPCDKLLPCPLHPVAAEMCRFCGEPIELSMGVVREVWLHVGANRVCETQATPQADEGREATVVPKEPIAAASPEHKGEPPLSSWPESVRAILEESYPGTHPKHHDKAVAALVALATPEAAQEPQATEPTKTVLERDALRAPSALRAGERDDRSAFRDARRARILRELGAGEPQ